MILFNRSDGETSAFPSTSRSTSTIPLKRPVKELEILRAKKFSGGKTLPAKSKSGVNWLALQCEDSERTFVNPA
jgi:hypothetical protein